MAKKINIYNTYLSGGAAIALLHITNQLELQGIDFKFFHFDKQKNSSNPNFILKNGVFKSKKEKLLSLLRKEFNYNSYFNQYSQVKLNPGFDLFSNPVNHWLSPVDSMDNNTIVHLNWISQFIDYPSFFNSIKPETPIIWSLHDANPFTGGCHVPFGCNNFQQQCENCPHIHHSNQTLQWASSNYIIKRKLLKDKRLIVVGNSSFTTKLAQQSNVFPKHTRFETIQLGLPTEQLDILNKQSCKKSLKLQNENFIIGFVANGLSNPNKGFHHFCNILKQLNNNGIKTLGLVLGSNPPQNEHKDILFLGNTTSNQFKAIFYNACDAVLTLSQFESFGLVPLESLFCGTPVFGFNSGGVKDIVYCKELGKLSKINDEQSVLNDLVTFYQTKKININTENIRKLAVDKFNIEKTTQQYINLYNSL